MLFLILLTILILTVSYISIQYFCCSGSLSRSSTATSRFELERYDSYRSYQRKRAGKIQVCISDQDKSSYSMQERSLYLNEAAPPQKSWIGQVWQADQKFQEQQRRAQLIQTASSEVHWVDSKIAAGSELQGQSS